MRKQASSSLAPIVVTPHVEPRALTPAAAPPVAAAVKNWPHVDGLFLKVGDDGSVWISNPAANGERHVRIERQYVAELAAWLASVAKSVTA
jgi:hypothetical protein